MVTKKLKTLRSACEYMFMKFCQSLNAIFLTFVTVLLILQFIRLRSKISTLYSLFIIGQKVISCDSNIDQIKKKLIFNIIRSMNFYFYLMREVDIWRYVCKTEE